MQKFKKKLLFVMLVTTFIGTFSSSYAMTSGDMFKIGKLTNLKDDLIKETCTILTKNEKKNRGFYFIINISNFKNIDDKNIISKDKFSIYVIDILVKYFKNIVINKFKNDKDYSDIRNYIQNLFKNYEIKYNHDNFDVIFYTYCKSKKNENKLKDFVRQELVNLDIKKILEKEKYSEYYGKEKYTNYIERYQNHLRETIKTFFSMNLNLLKKLSDPKESSSEKEETLNEITKNMKAVFENTVHTSNIISVLNQNKTIKEIYKILISILEKNSKRNENTKYKRRTSDLYEDDELYGYEEDNYDDDYDMRSTYYDETELETGLRYFDDDWLKNSNGKILKYSNKYLNKLNTTMETLRKCCFYQMKKIEYMNYEKFINLLESIKTEKNKIQEIVRTTKEVKGVIETIEKR